MQIWSNVRYYKLNTVIMIFLMFLGLTSFMVTTSFVETIQYNCNEFLHGTYTGNYVVTKKNDEKELNLDDGILQKIANLDEVKSLSRRVIAPVILDTGQFSPTVTLVGIEESENRSLCKNYGIDRASFFKTDHVLAVNKKIATENTISCSDEVLVKYEDNSMKLKVATISDLKYSNNIIDTWCMTEYTTAINLMGKEHGYMTSLMIYTNTENIKLENEIQDIIGEAGVVNLWSETSASNLMIAPTVWRIVLYVMVVFLFLLICIGCSALIMSSLLGRIKDVGIYKTLGWGTKRITLLYLGEIVLMFCVASILASVASLLVIQIVNSIAIKSDVQSFVFVVGSNTLHMIINWRIFVIPAIICAICCMAVVYFPIHKITKRSIISIINGVNE